MISELDEARTYDNWVKKSFAIPGRVENPLLVYNLQSLGKLDCDLSSQWNLIKNGLADAENIQRASQLTFLSSLWVMGAYEFIRVIGKLDRRMETKKAHELFSRVRIPMVKFEPPRQVKGRPEYPHDFGIAHAIILKDSKDLGWLLAPDFFISREELAQELYKLY
jgi:hypothetical protein